MMNRDLFPGFRTTIEVLADRVLDTQLAALLQQQNRGSGELFGDRAKPELGLRRVRRLEFGVGQTVAFAENHLAIASDKGRAGKTALLCNLAQVFIELGGSILR